MSQTMHSRKAVSNRIALIAMLIAAPWASGEVIYETEGPFGGPFGLIGFDVCIHQSVALRFTPDADYTFDRVSVWFMSNDFSGQTHPLVEVTLRTDDDSVPGVSIPSSEILEWMHFKVSAVGWNPVLEVVEAEEHPLLKAGVNYWIVCKSLAPCGLDGVWNWAATGTGFMSNTNGDQEGWQPGNSGAVAATIIEATLVIAGDSDHDGDVDLIDFGAYLDCVTGPAAGGVPQECTTFDFDSDNDVDKTDFAALQLAFTGAL